MNVSPSRVRLRLSLLSLVAIFVFLIPAGAGAAQAVPTTVNINSYLCPAGYDQVSDCTKIGGVVVSVFADGQPVAEVTTVPESSVDVDILFGQAIRLEIVGGAPADATLEPASLTFDAVEGVNPVTLVYVSAQTEPEPIDTDGDGVTDDDEVALGTDPNNPDSDEDGVQDGGEVNAGTDPLNPDTDGDGFTDREELDVQSDPLDPNSVPVPTEANSMVVTAYNCPAGYEGKDPWTDCTDPADGVEFVFFLNASEFGLTATTDASGTVSFTDLGAGQFTLLQNSDMELERTSLFCWGEPIVPDAPEPRQVNYWLQDDGSYGFELGSGENITCTWFNIPAADDGQPAPEPTVVPAKTPTTAGPVKGLPSTGTSPEHNELANSATAISGAIAGLSLIAAGAAWHTRRKA